MTEPAPEPSAPASPAGSGRRVFVVTLGLLIGLWIVSNLTAFRTRVEIRSQGGQVSLTVNERTIRGAGTIARVSKIRIETVNSVFPMGGEAIRVRQDGHLLFEERLPKRFSIKGGTFAPLGDWFLDPRTGGGAAYERDAGFSGDFTLEATFTGRCLDYTVLILEGEPTVRFLFRRGFLNNDFVINVAGKTVAVDALVSPLSTMALDALGVLVRAGIGGCLLVLFFVGSRRLLALEPNHPIRRLAHDAWTAVERHWVGVSVACIALIALGIRLWVSRGVLEGLAHTPDEVAYMLQAKWLLVNKLYQSVSPIQQYLNVPFTYVRDGKWFCMYPIGWPMLLAAGQAIGLPWIVSPICGALYVLLLFLIGRDLYGKFVGLAAAVLGALSPMAILMFSSYLSHGAAALMIALFVWLFIVGRRSANPWLLVLSGAALGFAFSIRPVTAIAAAVPFAVMVLWELQRPGERTLSVRHLVALIAGGIAGSLPVLISNDLITGRALSFAYSYARIQTFSSESLPASLMYLDSTLASVPPALFGWGWGILPGWLMASLALAFACVPFVLRRPRGIELALGAIVITLPLSFLGWPYHGLHGYGPRFYFEAFLGLYVLTAQGFFLLGGVDGSRSPMLSRRNGVALLAGVLFVTLVLTTAVTLKSRMSLYEGYNFVNGDLQSAVARAGVHRGLILLTGDDWFPWGQASGLLPSDLDSDLVFAGPRPGNASVIPFFPDRSVYTWRPGERNLQPIRPIPSAAPAPPVQASPGPPVPRFSTVLLRWLGLVAAGLAAPILIGRLVPRLREAVTTARARFLPAGPVRKPPSDRARVESHPREPQPRVRILPVRRALFGLAGILTAYLGESLLIPNALARWLPVSQRPLDPAFHAGWILLVVGAVLFGLAWRGIDPPDLEPAGAEESGYETPERQPGDARPALETGALLRARRILGAVAFGLYFYNAWDWLRRGETGLTRILWALSVILFLASLVPLPTSRARPSRRSDGLPRPAAIALLVVVLAIAFVLRVVGVARVPLDVHGDFTSIGLVARDILSGRVTALFGTNWAGLPVAAYLPTALSMSIFGDGLFGMDMEAVITGTVMVLAIYCLGSLLFNRSIGLLAAAVSAVGYTDIHFSRVSAYIDPVPWIVFGVYFLVKGFRSGSRSAFGLSGVLLAVGFEMYFSGRLIVLVLAAFVLYLGLFHARLLRSRWKGLAILLVAGVLTTGPMLFFFWRNREVFNERTREVYAFNPDNLKHLSGKYNVDSPSGVLREQFWRSALTFNYTGDSGTQFGFAHPMLNPALAPMMALGAAFSLWRLRRYGYALLLLWVSTGVVVGSILTIDAPFWPRLVIILPAVAILTGLGLFLSLRTVFALAPGRLPSWVILIPAAGVLAFVGYQNWQWYFHGSVSKNVAPVAWVGRLIGESPPESRFCMVRGPLDFADRVPQFLGEGRDMLDVPPEQLDKYLPRCVAEGRIWILIRPDHDGVLARLNDRWPQARQERHDFPLGIPGPIFWYPPPEATRIGRRSVS